MENPPSSRRVRKLGIALFCLALLVTFVGAFHVIENWRGRNKWETYRRELTARGEKLDLAAFVPPPVPDAQNFAATPFFAELFPARKVVFGGPRPTNWNRWPNLPGNFKPQIKAKRGERQLTDFAAMCAEAGLDTNAVAGDRVQAAEQLLAALKIYEPALDELRAASARPLSRYDIRYDLENPWGILLPHLHVIKEVVQLLSVKACAELARSNNEAAMADVRLMLRIVDSMEAELFLINYVVRVAAFQIALQPVWEGLALERWSDAQLEELQRRMLTYNFVEEIRTPLGAEQAAGILTADLILKQRHKAEFLNAFMDPGLTQGQANVTLGNVMAMFIPRGWYRLEQYEYTRLFQRFILPGSDGTNRVIHPGLIESNQAQLERAFRPGWRAILNHRFLAGLMMPAVGKTHGKAAHAQTAAHQAAIACALERYRRKHGQYPNQLAQLAPQFMSAVPHDVIGGEPMRYKPTKPVAIYSVGWDEADNGGTPGRVLWDERGDWVWTY